MADTVQQIKDRLSIVDVVSGYVKLERAGANYKGRCPFHAERTPSFFVSPTRGTYHCFGCSTGGDIFSFIQEIEGLDFKGAMVLLAERAGIPIVYESREKKSKRDRLYTILSSSARFFRERLDDTHPAYAYMRERGLSPGTLEAFGIGWAPDEWRALTNFLREQGYTDNEIEQAGLGKRGEKGIYDRFRSRIMFPIADSAGRIVAFSGRAFGDDEARDDVPKYINSPETELFHKSRILYGYDRAKQSIRKYDCALLVEGQMDLIASHQAGWSNTVAVSGTALSADHVALLMRHSSNLILALDADEAGLAAARRSASAALSAGMDVKVARLPDELDPADVIRTDGPDAWRGIIRNAKHVITFLLDVLEQTARDDRAFRKAVEQSVLPFVMQIKSAIDREHFIREVAARINVSENAVTDALQYVRIPDDARQSTHTENRSGTVLSDERPPETERTSDAVSPRAKQLFGVILWQRSLEEPAIAHTELEELLTQAIGEEQMEHFTNLSEREQEALRFEAETLYAEAEHVEKQIRELVGVVEYDRLRAEHEAATAALRRAEQAGDHEAAAEALARCNTLSEQIAKRTAPGYST